MILSTIFWQILFWKWESNIIIKKFSKRTKLRKLKINEKWRCLNALSRFQRDFKTIVRAYKYYWYRNDMNIFWKMPPLQNSKKNKMHLKCKEILIYYESNLHIYINCLQLDYHTEKIARMEDIFKSSKILKFKIFVKY